MDKEHNAHRCVMILEVTCKIYPIESILAKMRTYFFVQRVFHMGGIETLILRILPELTYGESTIVVSGSDGPMIRRLPANVIKFDGNNELFSTLGIVDFIEKRNLPKDIVFITFNPWSLVNVFVIRYILYFKKNYKIRSFYFAPHSRALFFAGNKLSNNFIRKIFLRAPMASTYFMNDVALLAHEKEWGMSLKTWPVLRLPLSKRDTTWVANDSDILRIVSIGRLVPFKGYNRAAPNIVASLLLDGIRVVWTIWGDGEDQEEVEALIARYNVDGSVRLCGQLAYENIEEELERHDLFIGMGTAMLEAGLVGIPTICALENGTDEGYGFLPDAPSDSVGDKKEGFPVESLIDTIRRFVAMSPAERTLLSQRCADNAQARSATLTEFAEAIRTASPWPAIISIKDFWLAAQGVMLLAAREVWFALARRLKR